MSIGCLVCCTTNTEDTQRQVISIQFKNGASLIAQLVKNPPVMQETPVRFLGQKEPLEKGKATHSSILGLPLWLSW